MPPKRLLHIITSMNPHTGGPCQGIRNMHYKDERSYVVEIVCMDSADEPYVNDGNIVIHALGSVKNHWQYHSKLVPWLVQHLPHYDTLIINGLWLFHSYAVWLAMRQLRMQGAKILPKIYAMPHGMLDPYFQKAKHRKLKAIRNWFYWKLIECKVVNDADGLLFTCEEELLLARTTFAPYKPKAEINIGYGIQAPPVYNAGLSEAFNALIPQLKGRRYYLFMSRIHNKKGVDLLIKAYKALYDKFYSNTSEFPLLVIAGPGLESSYGKYIKQLAGKLFSQPDIIFFPGMVSGNAKWGAYYGAEAFVLPSHQENFGIVVPEALACGVPVLITNKINIWREIQTGHGGIVANDTLEETIGLFEKWENLSVSSKNEMREHAKQVYEKYFRIEDAREKLINCVIK